MSDEIKIKKVTVRRPTLRELREKKIPLEKSTQPENQIVDVEFEGGKMSDEREARESFGWLDYLIKAMIDSLKSGLRFYPKDDDIDKLMQLYTLIIQHQPEIDKKYVEGKAREILEHDKKDNTPLYVAKKTVTQIISDVRGREVEMVRSDIDKFISLFTTLIGEELQIIIDEWIKYLESAGVKIK